MTETDLKLLAVVLREARELALDCENCDGCMEEECSNNMPSGEKLLIALDQFKFRASFTVPE